MFLFLLYVTNRNCHADAVQRLCADGAGVCDATVVYASMYSLMYCICVNELIVVEMSNSSLASRLVYSLS
jgi:hypothetical protein